MTVFTDIGRTDVIKRLASGGDAIMAVTASLGGDVLMIKVRRQPAVTAMTIITLRRGRQMIQVLAHGGDAIVTTVTGAQHLEMIDRNYRIPQVGAVAVFADVSGADVVK